MAAGRGAVQLGADAQLPFRAEPAAEEGQIIINIQPYTPVKLLVYSESIICAHLPLGPRWWTVKPHSNRRPIELFLIYYTTVELP